MAKKKFKKEYNVGKCKVCELLLPKITDHKYDKKNFRYVDNHGKFWNGRMCPACHKKAMKDRMQNLRNTTPPAPATPPTEETP